MFCVSCFMETSESKHLSEYYQKKKQGKWKYFIENSKLYITLLLGRLEKLNKKGKPKLPKLEH
jgi:hypothetical protein